MMRSLGCSKRFTLGDGEMGKCPICDHDLAGGVDYDLGAVIYCPNCGYAEAVETDQ